MTWDNYIIRVAGSFGGQKFFSRKSAVAEGLTHIQVSLRDVRHLPDDDVTPFSFAQRWFHLSNSCVLSFLCFIVLSISCKSNINKCYEFKNPQWRDKFILCIYYSVLLKSGLNVAFPGHRTGFTATPDGDYQVLQGFGRKVLQFFTVTAQWQQKHQMHFIYI